MQRWAMAGGGEGCLPHRVLLPAGDSHVFTREHDDAVLTVFIHLDNRMGGGARRAFDQLRAHAVTVKRVKQHAAVLTQHAGVVNLAARLGGGDGLVKPLAAAKHVALRRENGFAGRYNMPDGINVVDIHRAVVENFHAVHPSLKSPVIWP